MSDRPNQPNTGDDLPPIPDGGLGKDFPDWLRERPQWVTVVDAGPADMDTSAIDPRDLVGVDDLPEWLQAIARDPETRLQGLTLPELSDTDAGEPSDAGETVQDIVDDDPTEVSDDPAPATDDVEVAEADAPWVRTFAPYSEARTDAPTPAAHPPAEGTGQPFPHYIQPPAAVRNRPHGAMLADPWVIGLIGAALGIVIATIVFLIIQ